MAKRRLVVQNEAKEVYSVNQEYKCDDSEPNTKNLRVESFRVVDNKITLYLSEVEGMLHYSAFGENAVYCMVVRLPELFDTSCLSELNKINWSNLKYPNDLIKFLRSYFVRYMPKLALVSIVSVN